MTIHRITARALLGVTILFMPSFAASAGTQAAALVHIIVVAGQSNAVGYGADASELPPPLYRPQRDVLYQYDIGGIAPATDFTVLRWLPGEGNTIFPEFFGPELSLGHLLARSAPDAQFAVVKVAFNSTSLAFDWDPGRSGALFDTLTATVDRVIADLAASGMRGVVDGMFWMQGEADAGNQDWANAYTANLTAFIAACRGAFGRPRLPFVIGRIDGHIGATYRELVRAAEVAVADADPDADWVDTDALPLYADNLHFTAAGELGLGLAMARAFLRLHGADATPSLLAVALPEPAAIRDLYAE